MHADPELQRPPRPTAPLAPESLLCQTQLWDLLPSLLLDRTAPPAFTHAALSCLLQGLLIDPQSFSPHLRYPSLFPHLLSLLSRSGQLHLAATGHTSTPAVRSLLVVSPEEKDALASPCPVLQHALSAGPCADLCDVCTGLVLGSYGAATAAQQPVQAVQGGGGGQGLTVAGTQRARRGAGGGDDAGAGGGGVWEVWMQPDVTRCCSTVSQVITTPAHPRCISCCVSHMHLAHASRTFI